MDAQTYPLADILKPERRFMNPTFQRHYSGWEDPQWRLLTRTCTAWRGATSRHRRGLSSRSGAAVPGRPVTSKVLSSLRARQHLVPAARRSRCQ